MKKITKILIVLIITTSIGANAQSLKLAASTFIDKSSQKVVVKMKFIDTVNVVSQYRINVFRRESNGSWIKITNEPIVKATVNAGENYTAKGQSFKRYANFILRNTNTEKEKNIIGFAGLMLLNDNKMAEYAGCYFEDNNVTAGKIYEYKLTDADKNNADISSATKVNTATNAQTLVSGLSFIQQSQNVLLNWKQEDQHYAYKVYRKSSATATPVLITTKPILPATIKGAIDNPYKYADTGLKAGSIFYYQIVAIDVLNNESILSDPLKVTVKDLTLPKTVTSLTNERKKKNFELKWETAKDKNCIGYNVYRANDKESAFKKINNQILAVTTANFVDNTVEEKNAYTYYVESISPAGVTAKSVFTKAVMPDITPPAKPTGVRGTSSPGVTNISWAANKETDLKGYWVYRSTNKNKDYFNLITEKPITTNSFFDSLPVTSKNDYVYRIQAVDESYNKSEMSDTIVVLLPDVTAPLPIQMVDASLKENVVTVSWQKAVDDDVVGYNVFRSIDESNSKFEKLNQQPLKEFSFIDKDTALHQGNSIAYYITAVDKSNNKSMPSKPVFINIPIDTASMKAIEGLTISKNEKDSTNHITWRSNSQNISGYIVFRKSNNEESFVAISSLLSSNSFKDENTVVGETYEYYVRTYFSNNSFKNSIASKQ